MLDLFLSLPPALIVLVCIGVPVLVVIPVSWAVLKGKIPLAQQDTDGQVAIFGFIGTAFTLLLAFIIVNVWSDQSTAQNNLFGETTTLESVLLETQAFDPALAPKVKELVLGYLEDVRDFEIDQTPPSGGDPRTEKAFESLLEEFNALEKDLESNAEKKAEAQVLLGEVDKIIELRDSRVDSPSGTLDGMTTLVCVVLALLTVAAMALLPPPSRPWIKWFQSIGVALAVGIVVSLVFFIASDAYTKTAEDQQFARVEHALDLN